MPTISFTETVASLLPRAQAELRELISFRSVADPEHYPAIECQRAAEWIADALRAEGFPEVSLLDTPDGSQSVYGFLPGPAGAPTVLLYAHYDVQPPLAEEEWSSPPFELTERDGRWYGRGAADCKGGVLMHLTALRALRAHGEVPVGVKVIVEGSEEQGTGGLEHYAEQHPDLLAADAIIIGDTGNFRSGVPTATVSLRGMVVLDVSVKTLEENLHSGQFGGAAPDALSALIRMLGTLHDETGATTVDGLPAGSPWKGLAYPEKEFRVDAGVLDGVSLIGAGDVADRVWTRSSVTVLGIDAPPVAGAVPVVQASAKARVSLRVPPGVRVEEATGLLVKHLEAAAPWGARVETELIGAGEPFRADTSGKAYQVLAEAMHAAYGTELRFAGMGFSIPLCTTLAGLFPEAEILLLGLSDPDARIHAVNESVDPAEFAKIALAEGVFLARYAGNR